MRYHTHDSVPAGAGDEDLAPLNTPVPMDVPANATQGPPEALPASLPVTSRGDTTCVPEAAPSTLVAGSDSDRAAPSARAEVDARIVSELFMAGSLSSIVGGDLAGKAGVKVALDNFLTQAGSPKDPIERCMVEQFYLAHLRLAKLQVQADGAVTKEAAKVFNGAAVRLMGEYRRLGLSIRVYRLPPASKSFAVIGQQNIAAEGGKQAVKYVDRPGKAKVARQVPVNIPKADEDLHAVRERAASRNHSGSTSAAVAAN